MTPVNRLIVIIAGKIAGEVTRSENGRISFKYTDAYNGTPLSVSMPISNRLYADKIVRPYVYGRLPSPSAQRIHLHAFGPCLRTALRRCRIQAV